MTVSHSLSHRRAAAAAQRRQLGFDPSTLTGFPFEPLSSLLPVPPSSSDTSSTSSSTSDSTSSTTSTSSISDTSTTPSITSSSSIAPSTSSTTPTPTPSTTSPPLAQSTTTLPPQTAVVTQSVSRTVASSSSASAPPSSAADADASTGMSTGAVIGGIGAGIVAILVIGFFATWLIRRRKRDSDGGNFAANDFRRSGIMLDDKDEPAFNPRPPTMIERHLASPAPTFGTQYGAPGPAYNDGYSNGGYADNRNGYGTANYPSFGPGQVMDMHNGVPSPISATSAHPMYSNAPYGQNPFSPISQHGHYPQEYNESALSRQPSNASGLHQMPPAAPYYPPAPFPQPVPVLTRQGSNHSSYDQQQPGSPTAGDARRESLPSSDYVDLSRSSVSPFQAEQYVEISRRLNTEVPEGLKTADIDRDLPPIPASPMITQTVTNNNNVSPFSDPASAPPSPGGQYAIDNRNFENDVQTLEFPAPPSPIYPLNSAKSRIDSMPPMLPEINLESRVSVGNYPGLGSRDSNALGAGLMTPSAARFPTTPSPLASSFGFPSPGLAGTTFEEQAAMRRPLPATATGAEHTKKTSFDKKRTSMHSVYDAEDAYGGF